MSFASRYKTNKVAEENGVWVVFDDDVEVKVARLNNKKARDLRRTLEKPYRNFSTIPDKAAEEILIKVVAQAVIKDWKGVTDEDGAVIPFNAENAIAVLTEYPDFLNDVVNAAMARETFSVEGVEAAKNG